MALTPAHYLANILDVTKMGCNLSLEEKEMAMECAREQGNDLLPLIINFLAKARPFPDYAFLPSVVQTVSPDNWWRQHQFVDDKTMEFIVSLLTAKASSAGVERIFSSFGIVQSTLRNRLGNKKAGKFFLFKKFNPKANSC